MKSKSDMRKLLEAGMMAFIADGNTITKVEGRKRKSKSEPKEQIVEIEVDMLPIALQQKYFSES